MSNLNLLTPEDLMERLQVSRSTLYQILASERVPKIRLGRVVRYRETDIDEMLNRRTIRRERKVNRGT
jgi:excisionase family DNA binding protein